MAVYSGPCVMSPIPPDAPLYHVAGQLIDDVCGSPVPGAKVSMDSLCGRAGTTGRSEEDHFHLQVVTDPNGKFAFDKIPKMAVRLSASRDDYLEVYWFRRTADDPIGNYVIGPETSPITLRIAPAASISGIVRDQEGVSMPDAWVTLQCFRTWAGWRRLEYCNTIKTASDGSYRFGPLQPAATFLSHNLGFILTTLLPTMQMEKRWGTSLRVLLRSQPKGTTHFWNSRKVNRRK